MVAARRASDAETRPQTFRVRSVGCEGMVVEAGVCIKGGVKREDRWQRGVQVMVGWEWLSGIREGGRWEDAKALWDDYDESNCVEMI